MLLENRLMTPFSIITIYREWRKPSCDLQKSLNHLVNTYPRDCRFCDQYQED